MQVYPVECAKAIDRNNASFYVVERVVVVVEERVSQVLERARAIQRAAQDVLWSKCGIEVR